MTRERILYFTYSSDDFISNTKALKELLSDKGIFFECTKTDIYTRFYVRRSGRTWNGIYKLINSIEPARYRFL